MQDVNTLRRLLATTAAHFGLPRPAGQPMPPAAGTAVAQGAPRTSLVPVPAPASLFTARWPA